MDGITGLGNSKYKELLDLSRMGGKVQAQTTPLFARSAVTPTTGVSWQHYNRARQTLLQNPITRYNAGIPRSALKTTEAFKAWTEGGFGEEGFAPPAEEGGPQLTANAPGTLPPGTTGPGTETETTLPGEDTGYTYEPPPPPDYAQDYRTQRITDYEYLVRQFSGIMPLLDKLRFYRQKGWIMSNGQIDPSKFGNEDTLETYKEVVDALDEFREIKTGLQSVMAGYGMRMETTWRAGDAGDDFAVRVQIPYAGGNRPGSISEAIGWLNTEIERLQAEGESAQTYDDIMDVLFGNEEFWNNLRPDVDIFEDPNGWGEAIKAVFGEFGALPDTMTFLTQLIDILPMSNYTEAAMPNMTVQERFAAWVDDLIANGWDPGTMAPGREEEFLEWVYDMAESLHPERFFDFDRSVYENMTASEVGELMKLINYADSGILSERQLRTLVADKMRPIKAAGRKELRQILSRFAEKGRGYSSVVVKTTQEFMYDMYAAEMGETANILMDSIALAEQGKLVAINRLGQISDAELNAALQIAGLKGTLAGDYLQFLADIGKVATSQYSTRSQHFVAVAGLQLQADLGIAGLDLEKYIHEGTLDVEGLRLYCENYWQQQGFNFEVKKQQFNDAIMRWQTAADIADMIQTGNTNRLLAMADLAIKAQRGDEQAWKDYQQMRLENYAMQRGMDIQQAGMIANLMMQKLQMEEGFDLEQWVERNRAILEVQLARIDADTKLAIAKLQEEGAQGDPFWTAMGEAAGTLGTILAFL